MLRTGTNSLAAALSELGFKHVFHGLDSRTKPTHWAFFERAAIATWPEVNAKGRTPPPTPFTRKDWDELFGSYDAVTDLSCFWAVQLIDAYPDAKIILTERDFDKWFPSFDSQVIQPLFGPWVDVFLKDGWEPLCKFLEKDVPKDKSFPRVNDKASHTESDRVIRRAAWLQAARAVVPYAIAITAAYLGCVYWSRIV
ncbi:hypothetical protein CTAM01_13854 [Colletotrichum tamarilloi]|uniref:NAD dependent epimerase/dehydratase n=1 Tax=Colletotrichum tamarilloi TaxID=1209934 RepID=A0ABQ9QQZ4_9PEZI|nr:uncharacterized protein CTAM01_13854 [Colletotrichum tamarilloi]KAK1481796.1 hypothetical protein CTAM01_13854 [Colletotrichum tamarilloi]